MHPQRESLPAVTAAGVVAIIFAVIGILGCGLLEIAILALPQIGATTSRPTIPPETRGVVAAMYFVFFAIAVGQLVVAINVLRRRNWARITIIVWAALMAVLCALSAVAVFFVFSMVPQTVPGGTEAGPFLLFMKVFMLLVYGVPFVVGVWWLILFTRPRVVAAFTNPQSSTFAPMPMDASGFPVPTLPARPLSARKPSCPLPIAIIAGFDLSGAVFMLIAIFLPLPFQAPFFLFGAQIPNVPYKLFLGALGLSYAVFIVGIFKLKRWGLDSLLIVKSVFLLSGVVTLLNPRFMQVMSEVMEKATSSNPALSGHAPVFSHSFLEAMLGFSYAFGVALIAVMLIYRGRFLQAAEAAH
ncbi:MAG TPA: hypothetical protein VN025_09910 [Candidatus Dormibacteraeota bacterium]|jgi:hypothetical protein|nr:hypothetical protein [Candidatus Dormibacteraeota bacterium]